MSKWSIAATEASCILSTRSAPGSIGPQAPGDAAKARGKGKVNLVATPLDEPVKAQPQTLEEWQEAQEREDADILETRKCPEYTMTYRQAVGTEDVFLQVGTNPFSPSVCPLAVSVKLYSFTFRWANAQHPQPAVKISF